MPDPPYTTCAVRFSCYPLVALAEIWFSIERNTFPFSCGQWQTRVLRNRVLGAEPWADRAWQGVWRREECNPLQPTVLHCTAGADWCFLHLSAPHTPTIHPCISLFIIALTPHPSAETADKFRTTKQCNGEYIIDVQFTTKQLCS